MTTTGVPPPGAASPKPSSFERIIGVFISPNETFASIARQPDWVVPLLIILLVALAGGIVFAQRMDFGAPIREAMEERKDLPPDAADRAVRIGSSVAKVASYLSPVISGVVLLIIAAVLLLAFRLMGGEGNFLQAFSVTVYAWMPGVIKSIIMTVIVAVRSNVSALDLPILVRSNLAFLVSMKEHPMAFVLLSSLDIFTVWLLALLIIGFSYVSKFSKAKSAAIVITLWVIGSLFKLIGPAMRALRG
jgi:hypothetical protein